MKQYLKHENLPWLTLMAGGIGLLLRIWHLSTANEKGFITQPHFAGIALTVLSIGVCVGLILAVRSLTQANKASFNFPASRTAGFGALAAAVLFAIGSVAELTAAGDLLATICALAGILAAGCLAYAGLCRLKGQPCDALMHIVVCLWLILKLICMYRSSSSDPQLADYCYQIIAVVCAMFSAYYRATFDAGFGRRAHYAFFCLASIYCCCLSLAGPGGILLYVGIGVWLFTNLCSLKAMPRAFRGNQA